MKFTINGQEFKQEEFFNHFFATSLAVKMDDLTLIFMRGLAETLLETDKLNAMTKNLANFYGVQMFNKQTTYLVGGNIFRVEEESKTEIPAEVAAE